MKDKEKQIEEMASLMGECRQTCKECYLEYEKLLGKQKDAQCLNITFAQRLYDKGYRKILEDSVVLSREEYETLTNSEIGELVKENEELGKQCVEWMTLYHKKLNELKQASKETAEKILNDIGNHLKRYAHIHKYAENANKTKEEYADGTPVELNSVWEVLTLHKNGYDTYETMCELQDNIGYIQESRLLQEFEKDFRIYAKQFGVEIKE